MQSKHLKIETWTTREGKTFPITEMDDSHLKYAIAYIERQPSDHWLKRKLPALEAERTRRRKERIMVRPQRKEDTLIFGDE